MLTVVGAATAGSRDASAKGKLYAPLESTGGCIIGILVDTQAGPFCYVITG
jgi:hypothetical protein